MKSKGAIILVFILLLLPGPACAGSAAEPQQESKSPTHEMPRADDCSIITMEIRELSYSLKKVHKEIAHFAQTSNKSDKEQLVEKNADKLNLLQAKENSLREQIDLREHQLINCLHQTAMPGE